MKKLWNKTKELASKMTATQWLLAGGALFVLVLAANSC